MFNVAFKHDKLHRVVAQMDARNITPAKTAVHSGMRQDWWPKGEWTNTLVYGMSGSDPRN